jgi:hypothetical protein
VSAHTDCGVFFPVEVLHDLFDWSSSGIGAAGLMLTAGALWQATGAKKAALQARHAVYRRNASEDVKTLERLAADLLTAIETEQYGLASHQARDFISDCLDVREHHRERLGTDGGKLEMAFVLVRAISSGMQKSEANRASLIETAQRVVGDMGSLSGILSRSIDEEEQ